MSPQGLGRVRLALLERELAREVLATLVDQVGDRVADLRPLPGRERGPLRLRRPRRRDRAVDVIGARVGRLGERLAGDGGDDGASAFAGRRDPFAADEVLERADRDSHGATVPPFLRELSYAAHHRRPGARPLPRRAARRARRRRAAASSAAASGSSATATSPASGRRCYAAPRPAALLPGAQRAGDGARRGRLRADAEPARRRSPARPRSARARRTWSPAPRSRPINRLPVLLLPGRHLRARAPRPGAAAARGADGAATSRSTTASGRSRATSTASSGPSS